jgi:hypothetical protein
MYIESVPNRSSPPAILLRESYREGKVVSKRTIANLSKWPPHLIEGFKVLLQGKAITNIGDLSSKSGKAFGGSWVIKKLAEELLISKVLGKSKKAMLVMIMICGRILTQGSRRHLKFWKDGQAIEEIFGISDFDEDDLYEAMDWLEERQGDIEKRLFNLRYKGKRVKLFLYDITSSYLEGQYNELAEYGYNRDGKKGKKQIVYGLLTDEEGAPIEVRPLYHRKANRTRACVLIAMFAYMILHNIFEKCRGLNIPLKALLEKLDQIQTQEIKIAEQWIKVLPTEFRDDQQDILDILKIKLPKTISSSVPSKS